MATLELDVPSHCKAGVIVNPGPAFEIRVEMVQVPEPGTCAYASAYDRESLLTRIQALMKYLFVYRPQVSVILIST